MLRAYQIVKLANLGLAFVMRRYYIDVTIRAQPGDATEGAEPVIGATRITIPLHRVPDPEALVGTIAEEIKKVGAELIARPADLAGSISRFEADMASQRLPDLPPELRPN